MTFQKKQTGKIGEMFAVEFLRQKGYAILETNARIGRLGEIDVVAMDKGVIIFVEVKTRHSLDFGLPQEAVNFRKQEKLKMCAYAYLKKTKSPEKEFRFDVVAVQLDRSNAQTHIEHITNAF